MTAPRAAPAEPAGSADPVRIPVWYDFSSTLCYVAHRLMGRMAPFLEEQGIELAWQPLDLTQLLAPYERGRQVPEIRRANAHRVAADVGVNVTAPALWHDSRPAHALALTLAGGIHEPSWRERVFTAVFEEGRGPPDEAQVRHFARELVLDVAPEAVAHGWQTLRLTTEEAREQMVTGVPTFMLGEWPFGGIQTEETMKHMLGRYVTRKRAGML